MNNSHRVRLPIFMNYFITTRSSYCFSQRPKSDYLPNFYVDNVALTSLQKMIYNFIDADRKSVT